MLFCKESAACAASSLATCDRKVVCDDSLLRLLSPFAISFWLETLRATPPSCVHFLSPGAPPAPDEHRDPADCCPSAPHTQAVQAKTAGRCRDRPLGEGQCQGQGYRRRIVSRRKIASIIQEQGRGRRVQGGKAQPPGCQSRRCRGSRQKATGNGSDWGEACQRALGTKPVLKGEGEGWSGYGHRCSPW